jgi:hypothetical protein
MSKHIVKLALLVAAATSLWQCSSDSTQASCGEPLPLYNVRDAGPAAVPSAAVEAGCITAPVPPPTI